MARRFPATGFPPAAINPVAVNVLNLYPLGNVSPSIYRATLVGRERLDQPGGRVDFNASTIDQLFARYSYSGGYNLNPVSVRGTDVPGFPTRDDIGDALGRSRRAPHLLAVADQLGSRGTYLRHRFFFDQRLNQTPPSALGFGYTRPTPTARVRRSSTSAATRPLAAPLPGRATRRRTPSKFRTALSWTRGAHLVKLGGEFSAHGIDMFQAIAPNAFYVFAAHIPHQQRDCQPAARRAGDLLSGSRRLQPRHSCLGSGALRAGRVARQHGAHLQLRPPLRAHQPDHRSAEPDDRFIPGCSRWCDPMRPRGLVFPGDPGIPDGIARGFNTKNIVPRPSYLVWCGAKRL